MYANRSVLGSTRTLSLSTEHLNQEQSLISIPPPMCNLPYDPPHLSRWQQPIQRHPMTTNARSGSAVAQRNEAGRQRHASKAATLNDQFRALTLHPRNHCDPLRPSNTRPGILNATSYELSDDLRAKEIDMMERYYGGKIRAQRAARIIQARYREYRMRAQYARLRADRRTHSRRPAQPKEYFLNDDAREGQHLASMEDLVIDRAYIDWESEAAGSNGEGSIPDLTVEAKGNRSSAPSAATHSPDEVEISSQSCSNLTAPKTHRQQSSPGTGTGSTSGFVSSPGSCSSGSLVTESNQMHTPMYRPEPPKRQSTEPPQSQPPQPQQPVLYYLVDREEPRVAQHHQQQQQLYVAVPVKPDQQYVKVIPQQTQQQSIQPQSQQRYLTQPTTAAVLVRRSSTGSNSRQAPIWCTPDGKMYTLAYTTSAEKAKPVVIPQGQSPQQQQQQQGAVYVTPVKREGNGAVMVKLHHSSPSAPVFAQVGGQRSNSTGVSPMPQLSERLRKRLYRVCLNYFNK